MEPSLRQALTNLQGMMDEGFITPSEFQRRKFKLLDQATQLRLSDHHRGKSTGKLTAVDFLGDGVDGSKDKGEELPDWVTNLGSAIDGVFDLMSNRTGCGLDVCLTRERGHGKAPEQKLIVHDATTFMPNTTPVDYASSGVEVHTLGFEPSALRQSRIRADSQGNGTVAVALTNDGDGRSPYLANTAWARSTKVASNLRDRLRAVSFQRALRIEKKEALNPLAAGGTMPGEMPAQDVRPTGDNDDVEDGFEQCVGHRSEADSTEPGTSELVGLRPLEQRILQRSETDSAASSTSDFVAKEEDVAEEEEVAREEEDDAGELKKGSGTSGGVLKAGTKSPFDRQRRSSKIVGSSALSKDSPNDASSPSKGLHPPTPSGKPGLPSRSSGRFKLDYGGDWPTHAPRPAVVSPAVEAAKKQAADAAAALERVDAQHQADELRRQVEQAKAERKLELEADGATTTAKTVMQGSWL